jgi:DNA polymerase-4
VTRTVLHADMDAFYASVEQRDDPALRGRPVVVGGLGRRGVVSTASYEARKFGIRSAMPIGEARRRCPDAVFVRPRMEVYAAVSAEIRAVFDACTPLVEPLSLDEAFLDVTGSRALLGDGETIARRIQADVRARTGLTVSVGVATTKFVAKVASDLHKPAGLTVVAPGTERDFLDPLPVRRLWGAGPVQQERLQALGLETLRDVREAPAAVLAQRVGAVAAERFQALASGVDPRPVVPEREAKSIGSERTFEDDLMSDDEVRSVLGRLAEDVGRRLRQAEVVARTVRVKVRFPPFRTVTRQVRLAQPSDDDMVIANAARDLCAGARAAGEPVRLLGVTAADLAPRSDDAPRQLGLFEQEGGRDDPERGRKLNAALDAIRERFGKSAIRRGG